MCKDFSRFLHDKNGMAASKRGFGVIASRVSTSVWTLIGSKDLKVIPSSSLTASLDTRNRIGIEAT
jgi:ribosomal protein S5